jgi:elongation factor P--(R)-beta-lysine ligase
MTNIDNLVARARIVRAIRSFFDGRGFVEVETAVRIAAPAPEEHIDCPPCRDGGYLRASPELQMKKLLAAGLDKIYQIGPCFREGERGSRHNPEFTMIEWYRRDATYRDIAEDLKELLKDELSTVFSAENRDPRMETRSSSQISAPSDDSVLRAKTTLASSNNSTIRQFDCSNISSLPVRDAYLRFAGWDPWAGEWDQDRFDFDMATKVEPAIKEMGGGVFLVDYPPQAASLAKISAGGGTLTLPPVGRGAPRPPTLPVAERWEFYWDGMELANCFTELCDAGEQRRRFAAAKANRAALGESDYPLDEEFLSSLPRIGSAAGVALGVDRLVMVLTGAKTISDVRAAT